MVVVLLVARLKMSSAFVSTFFESVPADTKSTPAYSSDLHFLGCFRAFSTIFSDILTALCRVYIIIPRGPRINSVLLVSASVPL